MRRKSVSFRRTGKSSLGERRETTRDVNRTIDEAEIAGGEVFALSLNGVQSVLLAQRTPFTHFTPEVDAT